MPQLLLSSLTCAQEDAVPERRKPRGYPLPGLRGIKGCGGTLQPQSCMGTSRRAGQCPWWATWEFPVQKISC